MDTYILNDTYCYDGDIDSHWPKSFVTNTAHANVEMYTKAAAELGISIWFEDAYAAGCAGTAQAISEYTALHTHEEELEEFWRIVERIESERPNV